jgi:ERCC4-type nuclease
VVFCDGDAHYGAMLEQLARRDRGAVQVKQQKRAVVMQSPGEVLLTALPGIADGRAEALLKYCGSPAYALSFLTGNNEGVDVPGVGRGTMSAVRAALGLDDEFYLEVTPQMEAEHETTT